MKPYCAPLRSSCHKIWRAAGCLCLSLWLAAPAAQALDTGKDQPTQVQADRIEANQQTGVVTYRGRVRFARGDIDIHADRVEVRQHGEALHSIRASGAPVRFYQRGPGPRDEMRGTAARVDYAASRREVTLTGRVRLEQNGDVFEAATVHYRLDGGAMSAEGGPGEGQVRTRLAPRRPPPTDSAP